jgi:hypothetical protein
MRITLLVRQADPLELVAELVWEDGATLVTYAREDMLGELERIVEEGLSEWIGREPYTRCRTTPGTAGAFLVHLSDYIRRQRGLVVELKYSLTIDAGL